jgi:hypothetical protein
VVSEIAAATVAVVVVGTVAAIAVIQAATGKPFEEPQTLSFLAVAVVSFFFGSRGGTQVRQAVSNLATQLNGSSKPASGTTPNAPAPGS